MLGAVPDIIEKYGAVSGETAGRMVAGADWGLSSSGICSHVRDPSATAPPSSLSSGVGIMDRINVRTTHRP